MSIPIVIDYREKLPYEFPNRNTIESQLEVGDYSLEGFENVFAVERKTFDDLARSVGSDRLRFENEIRRANGFANRNEAGNPLPGTKLQDSLNEFTVVIEADKAELYNYRNQPKCPNYFSKIHPNSIIGTVEKWPNKYPSLEFRWAGNRKQGKEKTEQLLDIWYTKNQQS